MAFISKQIEIEHLGKVLEWAEQRFQRCTCVYENAERQYQKIFNGRQYRNYTTGDCLDWSEYGTKTLHSLEMHRHSAFQHCISSRHERDKAKKELDDYTAPIAVPCSEEPIVTNGSYCPGSPTYSTCCPGGEQDTNGSSSDDEDEDVEGRAEWIKFNTFASDEEDDDKQ